MDHKKKIPSDIKILFHRICQKSWKFIKEISEELKMKLDVIRKFEND